MGKTSKQSRRKKYWREMVDQEEWGQQQDHNREKGGESNKMNHESPEWKAIAPQHDLQTKIL